MLYSSNDKMQRLVSIAMENFENEKIAREEITNVFYAKRIHFPVHFHSVEMTLRTILIDGKRSVDKMKMTFWTFFFCRSDADNEWNRPKKKELLNAIQSRWPQLSAHSLTQFFMLSHFSHCCTVYTISADESQMWIQLMSMHDCDKLFVLMIVRLGWPTRRQTKEILMIAINFYMNFEINSIAVLQMFSFSLKFDSSREFHRRQFFDQNFLTFSFWGQSINYSNVFVILFYVEISQLWNCQK